MSEQQVRLIQDTRRDHQRAARELTRAISRGRFIRPARIDGDIRTLSTGREYVVDPRGTYRRVGKH